jgi:hypothetical protein
MIPFRAVPLLTLLSLGAIAGLGAQEATSVSQYGITWEFDKPHTVGQFVTGDYWVLGPVTVVKVTPAPGPVAEDTSAGAKSIYGATAMVPDVAMRNGSMIVNQPGGDQGYDSRLKNYKAALSVAFPCVLPVNQTLISTISNTTNPNPVLVKELMWRQEATGTAALKAAAVLTCLDQAPPADAFRPCYMGTDKAIYRTRDIQWDALPKLAPAGPVPSWEAFERYLQRPWLDHMATWIFQFTGPQENQPNYGREIARVTSMASLMLMLDVPRERKEKLLIGLVQFGIDSYGQARCGRHWQVETAHWNGRKWPILFAGIMLGDKDMQALPGSGHTVFLEDGNTYYGKGFFGDTALYQICFHSFARPTHEEKDPATWGENENRAENYRAVTAGAQVGTALAVQLMHAKALWNHDAFFDYYDRWMSGKDDFKRKASPAWGTCHDPFVTEMWKTYRATVAGQLGGTRNLKWVWDTPGSTDPKLADVPDLAWSAWEVFGAVGHFVPNPPPAK